MHAESTDLVIVVGARVSGVMGVAMVVCLMKVSSVMGYSAVHPQVHTRARSTRRTKTYTINSLKLT